MVQGILDQSKSSTSGSSKRIVETKLKTNCLWRNTSGLYTTIACIIIFDVVLERRNKEWMDIMMTVAYLQVCSSDDASNMCACQSNQSLIVLVSK